jgi:signal transduction histidine kinase
VSERKKAESELRKLHQLQLAEAEHLATLGEVAAGLAHEIKNPLAGIAAALEVLGGELPPGDPSRDIMADVQHQVKRIKSTVDDLLNYARPRPLQLLRSDLNSTVEQVVHFARQQAEARRVTLAFAPGDVPPIIHDPDQIQRMVLNLVLNATEAVNHGGQVEVSTAYFARDGVRQAEISVRDNGSGIAAEDLEKIFRPFYTTKGRKGTGLGLSLCRRIAELHAGTIDVSSRLGEGSTFTVKLPDRVASSAKESS